MKKIYSNIVRSIALSAVMFAAVSLPKVSFAQYYEQSNGNPIVVIDKKIGFNGSTNYFDNVDSAKKVFNEGDEIVFKIIIENKGVTVLNDLVLRDYLPKYLTMLMYPGNFVKADNSIEKSISSLAPGESKEFMYIARVGNLPVNSGSTSLIQLSNRACVSNNIVNDCDIAKYFVSYNSVPKTGANDLLVKTVSLVLICLLSVGLRKKARGF